MNSISVFFFLRYFLYRLQIIAIGFRYIDFELSFCVVLIREIIISVETGETK